MDYTFSIVQEEVSKMDNGKIQLHNVDLDDFIKAVDECKGDVYLETKDGDLLNL